MAGIDVETSRILDGVQNSKIRLDSPSMLKQRPDSFLPESYHATTWLRHNRTHDVYRVGRDFPRISADEVSGRFQHCNLGEANNRVDLTSSFDDNELWFHSYQETGDYFNWFCHKYGESDSIVDRFRRNLPAFDGFWHMEDLITWIDAIEDFFEEVNPPEHLRCKIVWYKMKGAAYYWWKQLQLDRNKHGKEKITSWPRMKAMLLKRFMSVKYLTEFPNTLDKNEKEEEGKQLVADDFTHNRCLTKVPTGAYIDKEEEIKDLDAIYVDEEDVSKKTNGFQPSGSNIVAHLDRDKISECEESLPIVAIMEDVETHNCQLKQRSVQSGSIANILELKHPSMGESQLKLLAELSTPTSGQSELGKVKEVKWVNSEVIPLVVTSIPTDLLFVFIYSSSLLDELVGSYLAQGCKFTKVEMVRKVATLLFDPGGNTYLLINGSFKKSQLSCSLGLTGSITGTIIFTLHSNGVIGNIFANILENHTVDFGKIMCDLLDEDIIEEWVVGFEHEATVLIMVLNNGSQAGNTFSAPNDVLRLGTYDVHFIVEEMLMCDFDLDKLLNKFAGEYSTGQEVSFSVDRTRKSFNCLDACLPTITTIIHSKCIVDLKDMNSVSIQIAFRIHLVPTSNLHFLIVVTMVKKKSGIWYILSRHVADLLFINGNGNLVMFLQEVVETINGNGNRGVAYKKGRIGNDQLSDFPLGDNLNEIIYTTLVGQHHTWNHNSCEVTRTFRGEGNKRDFNGTISARKYLFYMQRMQETQFLPTRFLYSPIIWLTNTIQSTLMQAFVDGVGMLVFDPGGCWSTKPLRVSTLITHIQKVLSSGTMVYAEMIDSWFNCPKSKSTYNSNYGFGCVVYHGNQSRAERIASQLRFGGATLTESASNYICQPLTNRGVKDGGFGRILGMEGLQACYLVKSIVEAFMELVHSGVFAISEVWERRPHLSLLTKLMRNIRQPVAPVKETNSSLLTYNQDPLMKKGPMLEYYNWKCHKLTSSMYWKQRHFATVIRTLQISIKMGNGTELDRTRRLKITFPNDSIHLDTGTDLTSGRGIPWESWKDEYTFNMKRKFILIQLSVVAIFSCLSKLCDDGNVMKALKLFHKLVNGLDPPKDFMLKVHVRESPSSVDSLVDELYFSCEGGWR